MTLSKPIQTVVQGNPVAANHQPVPSEMTVLLTEMHAETLALSARDGTAPNPKSAVVAATTANVALTGAYTVDGVTVTNGQRYLAKDQTDPAENGIYTYNSAGAHTRATDLDADAEVDFASTLAVGGSAHGGQVWQTTASGITLGTDPMVWVLVQSGVTPDDLGLATVATSGDYDDLTNNPTLGTAAATDADAYATSEQGTLADSAKSSCGTATHRRMLFLHCKRIPAEWKCCRVALRLVGADGQILRNLVWNREYETFLWEDHASTAEVSTLSKDSPVGSHDVRRFCMTSMARATFQAMGAGVNV
ncbi:hypothetical protein [Puniceibacterium sp. IMCC21224]|uniref:hypothetical protein n=1 Tax=Puniceibacterium sp. IMCC21224 TaxID=1618204 RepID=UPI00065DB196|nr:hypothetical protein [Puniceibacterium sp. IMCC21224]KMK67043.1 hypothetical protein IMCC21224_111906 [Puniceibacterium sp. IMCC21224]